MNRRDFFKGAGAFGAAAVIPASWVEESTDSIMGSRAHLDEQYEVTYSYPCRTSYVDVVNGDDNNDGTSWDTAWLTLQKGIDFVGVGDHVILCGISPWGLGGTT
jgi:hypothetical protein